MEFKSSNPVFGARAFSGNDKYDEAMTIQGTINKTGLLFGILLLAATPVYFWAANLEHIVSGQVRALSIAVAVVMLALGAFTTYAGKKHIHILAPLYALVEGVFVGASTGFFNFLFPGVAFQAVILTLGVFFLMLGMFRTGIIKPNEKFKAGVAAAAGAFVIYYTINLVYNMFSGHNMLTFGSPISIGVSAIAVVVASLCLVLDFDQIEEGSSRGAPKYMEWYCAFGLMVTIVWLYLEMMRLLAQLRNR